MKITENSGHRSPLYGTRVPLGQVYIETNPGSLELPLTQTNFHGPKPVQATESKVQFFNASLA